MKTFKVLLVTEKEGRTYGYGLSMKAKTISEVLNTINDVVQSEGHKFISCKIK